MNDQIVANSPVDWITHYADKDHDTCRVRWEEMKQIMMAREPAEYNEEEMRELTAIFDRLRKLRGDRPPSKTGTRGPRKKVSVGGSIMDDFTL